LRLPGSTRPAWRRPALACVLLGLPLAAACTHQPFQSRALHYATFNVGAPKGSIVNVCHSYGCRTQTKVRFGPEELKAIGAVMKDVQRADTPHEERRAVAHAIGWMERHVGEITGTKADRPGMDFVASGDRTQQDCVDEATNTTSYLVVLENNGLIKHHTVGTPFAKENYLRGVAGWTHWAAVLKEKTTGQKWAVDSWIYKNGENPAVVEAEKWYIDDLNSLPKPTL